jgi:WS/DGAT/MGAT family acyltransferase
MVASTSVPESVTLSDEDLAILAKESQTVVGHVGKVIVVGPTLIVDDLRASLERRIAALPSLTRRLGGPPGAPAWIPDPTFRLEDHIVDATGPMPLTTNDLNYQIAELFAQRLDRSRPLWRIDVLGPLEDGSQVLVWRVHHALADGQTAVRFATALLWDAANGTASPASEVIKATAAAELHHRRHRNHLTGFLEREFRRDRGPSPFDGQIGAQRSVAFATVQLNPLRLSARSVAGATVNDAVLACVAGGLRRWMVDGGNEPLQDLRCKVPVSMHDATDTLGNRDSFFYLGLPLGEPDPAERLRLIRQESAIRKTEHDAQEIDRALAALSRASTRLRVVCDRFLMDPREFALNVSNVPGPRSPVSVVGCPVQSIHDLADIAERHALRVAAVSYAGHLGFGLCADAALIQDLPGLADAIQAEAADLIALAPPT